MKTAGINTLAPGTAVQAGPLQVDGSGKRASAMGGLARMCMSTW